MTNPSDMNENLAPDEDLSFAAWRKKWFGDELPSAVKDFLEYRHREWELAMETGSPLGTRTWPRRPDNLHVGGAVKVKAERFWTFDEKQAKLAKAQRIKSS